MFSKHIIVGCLLVFYGIPASVGPHWHHHHHHDACCEAVEPTDSAETGDPHSDQHSSCECAHSHADQEHCSPLVVAGACESSDNESCAICSFYSQSQFIARVDAVCFAEPYVHRPLWFVGSVGCLTSSLWQARAPPELMLRA